MIINRLKIHNFGVYIGEHTFELTPKSDDQPVVLIGALNGAGKTTFLNAIQFAFYGKLAPFVVESGISYDAFLRKAINNHVPQKEGASIEVDFSVALEGKSQQFRLTRTWFVAANERVSESFDVSILSGDSEISDKVLTNSWFDFFEDILPTRIMPLFFFDGENIEDLADDKSASKILETAVNALLGMDIVDQLRQDLKVYVNRKAIASYCDQEKEKYAMLNNEAQNVKAEIDTMEEEKSVIQETIQKVQSQIEMLNAKFASAGGDIFESHSQLETNRAQLLQKIQQHTENMEEFVARDETPLLLIIPLLEEAADQADAEAVSKNAETVFEILVSRDNKLSTLLESQCSNPSDFQSVTQFLQQSRDEFKEASKHSRYLELSDRGLQAAHFLNSQLLGDRAVEVDSFLEKMATLDIDLLHVERLLASVPEKHKIQPILDDIERRKQTIDTLHRKYASLQDELHRKEREHEQCTQRLSLFLEQKSQEEVSRREATRSIEYADKACQTLERFRISVIAHHISGIEKLIVECFDELTRKNSLISRVKIDHSDFSIRLKSQTNELKPKDLSAGERQLLAVAILWALSRYSNRPIPTIIDTPLGRLDSIHRSKLIEEYFPKASHQVILLSTDEEIYGKYEKDLQSSMSRSYLIEFDEASGGSRISEGYFS